MADQNIWDPNPQPEKKQPGNNKPMGNMSIVAYNLLGLAFYTIVFKMLASQGGFLFDAFVLLGHFIVCFVMAISSKSWMWVLSGVLVVAIGFSTCVMVIGMG